MHSARAYKMIFCFTAIIVLCLNVSDRCLDGRTTLHKATMLCVAPHGKNKKAVLSQRGPRDAPYISLP